MNYKTNYFEKVFFLISIINVIVICITGVGYLTYATFVYLILLKVLRKTTYENFMLLSLFVPNKYIQLLAVFAYVFLHTPVRKKRLHRSELAFLIYIFGVGLVNCLFYGNIPLGTVFQVGVYYCILKILASFDQTIDKKNVMMILDSVFIVQIIAGMIQALVYRSIGDCITGTMISAHYLGVYLVIYSILKIKGSPLSKLDWKVWGRVLLSIVFLYLTDAKHVWMVFLFALFAAWLLKIVNINNKIMFSVIAMTLIIVCGTFIVSKSSNSNILSGNRYSLMYLLNEDYNKKYLFFLRTFEEMLGVNGFLGFGVGQFGSQICLTLSKGIIYSWDTTLSGYHFCIEPYACAIQGLMTEWYTKYGIPISSMVLGYPLVSYIGLFAELGVVGFVWLLKLFDNRFKNENSAFVIAFFMLTVFDTYFEIPCVLILILIATYTHTYAKRPYATQVQG